jgi:hypothetical protein
MNLAVRQDRKTVTRRLDHLKEINLEPDKWECGALVSGQIRFYNATTQKAITIKPRYHAGQTVYVKEAHYAYGYWKSVNNTENGFPFKLSFHAEVGYPIYFEDTKPKDLGVLKGFTGFGWFKRSPLFLEAKYARTFIKIKDVRAERLQEITPSDVTKEGLGWDKETLGIYNDDVMEQSLIAQYHTLWDSINPDYPFVSNPFVWRIEFKRVEKPSELK